MLCKPKARKTNQLWDVKMLWARTTWWVISNLLGEMTTYLWDANLTQLTEGRNDNLVMGRKHSTQIEDLQLRRHHLVGRNLPLMGRNDNVMGANLLRRFATNSKLL